MDLNYNTLDLLNLVIENRGKHSALYEEAVTNYRGFLKKELYKMLSALEDGKLVDQNIKLKKPECYTKEYDKAIKMLSLTSDKEIKLTEDTFTKLVMDDWHWQRSFISNTMSYVGVGTSSPTAQLDIYNK